MRDDRPEKDRYPRASLSEQLSGELRGLRRSPGTIWLLVALVGGWLVLTLTRPEVVEPDAVRTGDCLYIRAIDADLDDPTGRAIGSDGVVVASLFDRGAERAPCDGSHGHEAAADAFLLPDEDPYPGQGPLAARHVERCVAAFTTYVGRPPEGSTFTLLIAVPPPPAWEDGVRTGVCLVARRDGAFMGAPARGSGQ